MAASLADVLVLLYGADERFGSLRAVVREWRHHERTERAWRRHDEMSQAGSLRRSSISVFSVSEPGEPGEPTVESVTRTRLWWRKPDHVRLERRDEGEEHSHLDVAAGRRWWSWSPDCGATSSDQDPEVHTEAQDTPFPVLLDPCLLLAELRLEVAGPVLHAGRRAIAVTGRPRRGCHETLPFARLEMGADLYGLLVDAERGVIVRVASEIDGEAFAVAEIEEMAFDENFEPATFSLELPPGEEFRPLHLPAHEVLTLDEAARRAPFTVLAPARVPRGPRRG